MSGETQPTSGSRQRIDKWLFCARMAKSRSLAQSHIRSGNVRSNGERCN
ncbi:S4 domain-containing protein, partial [Rhizobium ruizarguesonis]